MVYIYFLSVPVSYVLRRVFVAVVRDVGVMRCLVVLEVGKFRAMKCLACSCSSLFVVIAGENEEHQHQRITYSQLHIYAPYPPNRLVSLQVFLHGPNQGGNHQQHVECLSESPF